ncbi:CocE/NonD family hydrolase [Orbus sasakiae]|uniref:CocE/NonD family hydrolase n=1 Tax=Orbus sasakiae TaxID=1078475 RepID=A0ABP9N2A4_9GAMM
MKLRLIVPIFIIAFLASFFLYRLSDFDLSGYPDQRIIQINYHHQILEGTLLFPPNKEHSPTAVILVHGDGPQDRFSDGGYTPLIKHLLKNGIAVFSWDKPGVGSSQGNWLAQTMHDRANETAFILELLRLQPELKNSRIGLMGFSQAGWVIPQASHLSKPDFSLLLGPAINWREQGFYYIYQRLKLSGLECSQITSQLQHERTNYDKVFTQSEIVKPCESICTRFDFERRNALIDATNDITNMVTPVMILVGKDDINVDPLQTVQVWSSNLPKQTPHCIKIVRNATHSLLNSDWFNYQQASQWPWWHEALFILAGSSAYSPNVLNDISDWVLHQQCHN